MAGPLSTLSRRIAALALCAICTARGAAASPGDCDIGADFEAFSVAGSALAIAVAALDGDGLQDVAIGTLNANGVTVLFRRGSRGFANRLDLSTPKYQCTIVAADLDGDGVVDLVSGGGEGIYVFRGLGRGAFAGPAFVSFSTSATNIKLVDVNDDQKPDLVSACGTQIKIFRGHGDGTFGAPTSIALGATPRELAIADMNGDGSPDLATANPADSTISLLMNHGDGTFGPSTSITMGGYPQSIAIADFDVDGDYDIVVGRATARIVSVFRNRGDGTFLAPVDYAPAGGSSVRLLDLDGDGRLDIASADGATSVTTFMNKGDGTFAPGHSFRAFRIPFVLEGGSFDRDGNRDLVVGSNERATVSVLHGNGDGTMGETRSFAAEAGATHLVSADINHDGVNDALTCSMADGRLGVLLGDGRGGLSANTDYPVSLALGAAVVGDFNADGEADVAMVGPDDSITGPSAGPLTLMLGSGGGRFGPSYRVTGRRVALSVASGDVDEDGRLDLVSTVPDSNGVCVEYGNGDGTFRQLGMVPPGVNGFSVPAAVALVDVDRDGHLDLLVVRSVTNVLTVLRGNGQGQFAAAASYPIGDKARRPAVGDLNGDGWPDIAVANFNSSSVSVLVNRGDGTFSAASNYQVYEWPTGVAMGDLDGDGFTDLVASIAEGTLMVFFGNGTGGFSAVRTYGAAGMDVAISDQDRDGVPEIVSCAPGVVTVLPNHSMRVTGVARTSVQGQRGLALEALENPARARFTMRITSLSADPIHVQLFDVCGRRLMSQSVRGTAGSQTVRLWNTQAVSPGVYLVRAEQRGRAAATRIAVIR